MASRNIDRNKILKNVQKDLPYVRKPEDIVDVITAAIDLQAFSLETARAKGKFLLQGAKPYAMSVALQHGVIEVKKTSRFRFLIVERGGKLRSPAEEQNALNMEHKGLYDHLIHDPHALKIVAEELNLPAGSGVIAVRKVLEQGNTQQQIDKYDRVVSALKRNNAYDATYDYLWMGFRTKPYKYWLSRKGTKLADL